MGSMLGMEDSRRVTTSDSLLELLSAQVASRTKWLFSPPYSLL